MERGSACHVLVSGESNVAQSAGSRTMSPKIENSRHGMVAHGATSTSVRPSRKISEVHDALPPVGKSIAANCGDVPVPSWPTLLIAMVPSGNGLLSQEAPYGLDVLVPLFHECQVRGTVKNLHAGIRNECGELPATHRGRLIMLATGHQCRNRN